MIRVFSTLLAVAVLGLALYRVFQDTASRGKSPAQDARELQQNDPASGRFSVRWRSKNILSVPVDHVEKFHHILRRGDEVVLIQKLPSKDLCSAGRFIFIDLQRTHFIFKSLNGRKTSQLESWAMQTKSTMTWQIINPKLPSGLIHYLQKCERWLHTGRGISEVELVSTRRELFLSSKEFSGVWPLSPVSSLSIEPDLIRGGWRISSPKGGWQSVVVLGAQNGLKQKLTLRFPIAQEKTSQLRQKRVQRTLNKPLGLPGWD